MSLISILLAVSGFVVLLIPFWQERFPKWIIISVGLLVLVLSLIKGCSDDKKDNARDKEREATAKKVDYLVQTHRVDSLKLRSDSANNSIFLISLFEKYQIRKDSNNNPIMIKKTENTFYNKIGTVHELNQGGN